MTKAIERRVKAAVEAALDKKAFDLHVLKVGEITSIADYFILCSASNERQSQAIVVEVEDRLREGEKTRPRFVEGANLGRWILIDYGDFILHVFTEEVRRFYGLERLWGDAPDVTADFLPEAERERRQTGR